MPGNNFWSVNWGADEAKGDHNLRDYFVAIPEYQDILDGKKRYIVGRKGTGKTAICEKIRLDAVEEPLWFTSAMSLKSFPVALVRDLRDKTYRDKSQFVPAWTFLIATEFARLVVRDEAAQPREIVYDLERFLKENFPAENFSFAETLTTLSRKQAKVVVKPSWLELGSEASTQTEAKINVHYQRATDALVHRLSQIRTESVYFIFMDELDEGYRAGDSGLRLILLALLRAVENIASDLGADSGPYRPIAVLRSDIFDALEDNDINKLDDYIVRLRWRASADAECSLRTIIDARIRASLDMAPERDPWHELAKENDPSLPGGVDSLWTYICGRTFERPRDVVKYLKECRKAKSSGMLTFQHVRNAEHTYSDWFYRELKDEIHSHLPVWHQSLEALTRIGVGKFPIARLLRELNADMEIGKWIEESRLPAERVASILFNFGVIGTIDENGTWLFKYKDGDLSWNPQAKAIVHWGFHKKLRIRPFGGKRKRGRTPAAGNAP
jgi:hypothetical protein